MQKVNYDVKKQDGTWSKTIRIDNFNHPTKSYQVWLDMKKRCYSEQRLEKYPSYMGCEVSEDFMDFNKFTEWYTKQIGYGIEGYHLDKDLLYTASRHYSEKTVVLIPAALNSFLTTCKKARGEHPLGVHKTKSKFSVTIKIDGKTVLVGSYQDVETARLAYKTAKEGEARRWYKRLSDKEFLVDSRVLERMRTWEISE